ncbi:MAG TPA: histidine kinase [Cyclobacteriaceae bacterium]|nr:histidine kinase [Cyclobacteriaceae bacterium]
MKEKRSHLKATWLLHAAAWLGYVMLHATIWRDHASFSKAFFDNVLLLPPKLLLVYVTLLVLVPKYLLTKRYTVFGIALAGLIMCATVINQFYIHYVVHLADPADELWDLERISKRLTFLSTPLLVTLTFEGIELNTRLQKEKLAAELALLKNQLQPHFFFNTLNNLYSLVLQKSDLAPDLILRLSDMMRYILTSSARDTVGLKEEIDFILNYIAIEKIRYGRKVNIEASFPQSVPAIPFPPLILFTLIENAFKHGVIDEIDEAKIHVRLSVDKNVLTYEVRNSMQLYTPSGLDTRTGIGLRNLEQRLKLIYGERATLRHGQNDNTYTATLTIAI